MKTSIFRISNKYNIIELFEYISFDKTLKIILYNKTIQKHLKIEKNYFYHFFIIRKAIKPTYQSIIKNIPLLENQNNNEIKLNNNIILNEQFFYKTINSMKIFISINLKDKKWKIFLKNILNIKLEINPSIIDYIYNMQEKEKKETLDILQKYSKNIKEIHLNGFNEKNELNFEMRNKINYILNFIFKPNKRKNSFNIKKLSFEDNFIISILDINNLFIEFTDIICRNNKYSNIEQLYVNSKTAKNSISNLNIFIKEKIPNLTYINLYDFNFVNNNNSLLLSKLFSKLKFLNSIDLSGCICDNNNMKEIFNDNNNLELKELKFKLLYGDKMINWNFLNKFYKFLEKLEIEMIFPYNVPCMISYELCFHYKYINAKDLFLIINKMEKLRELNLNGEHLNNYNLNLLQNDKIINLTYSFYIINPEKSLISDYNYTEPSFSKTFLYNKNMKEISLIYNYLPKSKEISDNYNGIDLLCQNDRENAFKLVIFEFPENLTSLSLTNFKDKHFLKFYLIPLLKKNNDKLSQIRKIKLNNCFLDVTQFEEFLSMLPLINNLNILSINNIIFYNKFKMKDLINFIPTIFKNTPNLIELDISNNKYTRKIFIDPIFNKIKEVIPKTLINLKVFNNQIPISNSILKNMKDIFGRIMNYENAKIG